MVIFAALFIVITTVLFGAFGQQIQDFLRENILGKLFRLFSRNIEAGEEVEASTLSPSSTITIIGSEFDVFLSFRGEDTRKGFTGHLYEGLQLRGVSTFKDDVNLDKGKKIDRLLEYIEKSKIFVVILSKRFAESRWCLKEVTKSIECGKEIVPVFYGVEPSDVRNQSGPFRSAFKKHESSKKENQEEVRKWREAMKTMGNLAGFTLNEKNGDETELKLAIIHKVLDKKKKLLVAKHPVGIETRLQEVVKMLENESINGVHVVGICGMGGLGKTTIAMAVYNKYLTKGFNDASCFLSNISENFGQPNGLVDLQKQFIRDIFKQKDISLRNVADGKFFIKDKIKDKRVLLILDDIDSVKQLDALVGEKDLFGSGSVIIITTRDKKVLVAYNVKEHEIYEPAELNEKHSRELFLKHAFNGQEPKADYLQLSKEAVAAASGLPLTLEVLGSLLTCDMHVQEWKYTLDKLKNMPPQEVLQRLKLSYDRLDKYEQKIFLDISCFFIGWRKEYVTYMWEGRHSFPKQAIEVLEQRYLIKIDEKSGEFRMHDQIRDMGRAIVGEESSGKVEKQSRLWNSEDSLNLLQKKVPAAIAAEGIRILPEGEGNRIISADCFQNMSNLRYFEAEHLDFQGTLESFPRDLKWLELWECNFYSPPSDHLNLQQLVILGLYETNYIYQILVQQLQFRAFEKLKVLQIEDPTIQISPDFTNIPCLVELSLCRLALSTIDESIGKLKDLAYLEIKSCGQLEKLPDSVGQLKNLKRLSLEWCFSLQSLPERLGDLENLRELILDHTKVEVKDDLVGQLKNLKVLSVEGWIHEKKLPSSIKHLVVMSTFTGSSLELIELSDGGQKTLESVNLIDDGIKELPDCIKEMGNLKKLSLSCEMLITLPNWIERLSESLIELFVNSKHLTALPDCVGRLYQLENLSLECECENFFILPDLLERLENLRVFSLKSKNLIHLPATIHESWRKLEILNLSGCEKLKDLTVPTSIQQKDSMSHLSSLQHLNLIDCMSLEYLPQLPSSLEYLWASACSNLRKISDVSNLKRLIFLHLQGCELLEDVPGLQNISNNLTELALPGPCDLMACCRLSHDFKNKVFKEMDFARLEAFLVSGSMNIGSLRGHQQLHFMIPTLSFDWLKSSNMKLVLEKVDSPVHVEIMADDIPIFEKSLELSNDDFSGWITLEEEDLVNIGEGDEKHCYMIQVTIEEASHLQRIELLLYIDL